MATQYTAHRRLQQQQQQHCIVFLVHDLNLALTRLTVDIRPACDAGARVHIDAIDTSASMLTRLAGTVVDHCT